MRTLAIGDIHGCTRAFDTLLAQVAPQPGERIITLGDYVDRGPDSRGVIERLLDLRRKFALVSLRGNHDQMMIDVRKNNEHFEEWLDFGGRETLASYARSGAVATLDDVPDAHWDFLENCVEWHEIETHFFVHGNVVPNVPLAEQPSYVLLWEKFHDPPPHCSGKVMICGHTAEKSGLPRNLGHAICIDTYVYGDGWLTCLDVIGGRVWQANQRGEQRTARINDLAVADDVPDESWSDSD